MHGGRRRGRGEGLNAWPGWVDALSSLIMVIIFLLMIFVVGQFYLSQMLTGRDQALVVLDRKIAELTTLLGTERQANAALRQDHKTTGEKLETTTTERDHLGTERDRLTAERDRLVRDIAALQASLGTEQKATATLRLDAKAAATQLDSVTAERTQLQAEQTRLMQDIASLQADLQTLRQAREKLESDLAALALAKQTAESNGQAERQKLSESLARQTEALRKQEENARKQEEAGRKQEETGRQRDEALHLSEEQRRQLLAELTSLRDRSKALETRLAEGEERTTLAQRELAQRDIRLQELTATLTQREVAVKGEREISAKAQARIAALAAEMQALQEQLAKISTALDLTERQSGEQKARIQDLSGRLAVALANKVEELGRYRSEFFGRLRESIGTRPDIRIVGDRFVFQSEVLFSSGSADLEEGGKGQLASLAHTLLDIARRIPPDVNWILRVDGHTDRRPIATAQFRSNWELSTARAISVVRFLVDQGIPASHLAATGFGEFQPLESNAASPAGPDTLARDRRIELKLDQK